MGKYIKSLSALALFTACTLSSAQIRSGEDPTKIKSKGFSKTANPFTHYLYKNGFRDYTVTKIETKTETETKSYNELRFHSVNSQNYTKILMYNAFGPWHRAMESTDNNYTLVWRDVKLLPGSAEKFTVFTNGVRSFRYMYAAVNVFDSENRDCLAEGHPMREKLIRHFSEKIWNLGDSKAFDEAWSRYLLTQKDN
ncbi:hypothetical protein [Chryseobacterium sp.]|uniref:hypothetical protein n=1 Tax=Chryseobacterium sp. TaxID=1871047 RepID=UPI0012A9B359|nr:hypothetical protein [Chryseobacterium sp.]QFG52741.1 hypothetical protein F7R58_04010 [Chryseobacterium sp.]